MNKCSEEMQFLSDILIDNTSDLVYSIVKMQMRHIALFHCKCENCINIFNSIGV